MASSSNVQQEGEHDAVALQPMSSEGRSRASPARRRRPTIEDCRQPSIRLRRLPSYNNLRETGGPVAKDFARKDNAVATEGGNRRRSSSEPQRLWNPPVDGSRGSTRTRPRGSSSPMPPLGEEAAQYFAGNADANDGMPHELARRPNLFGRASTAARSALGMNATNTTPERPEKRKPVPLQNYDYEYENNLVDFLDVVDPEIATLSTLTNLQNSMFVPNLGRYINRRPTYTLTREQPAFHQEQRRKQKQKEALDDSPGRVPEEQTESEDDGERPIMGRSATIASHLSETEEHYAVLPDGISLKGWSNAEKQELNDHVRHMLHSRRAALKRSLKGFGQYIRRPLGFFVTLYAFLITAFGLLWVLFLIGWISVGGKQAYTINVIDNVLVALFAIMGDGLIPFRIVDTYHMIFIAHYHHLTWDLRKKKDLPKLVDHNDLPGLEPKLGEEDVEANYLGSDVPDEEKVVLNPKQLATLKHHQDKFSSSHTFYKPHETDTHRAFPLRLLVAIVVLLDFHSIFQVALGSCTWAINYKVRPAALTTTILCCSIACNITGGILISIGDKRTRKKEVVERIFRQQLTEQAIEKMEKRRRQEQERNDNL